MAISYTISENGVLRDMTPSEKAQVDADVAEATVKADAEAQKATDKANGNQKLLDLGLTQAEATALTNYTPPEDEL